MSLFTSTGERCDASQSCSAVCGRPVGCGRRWPLRGRKRPVELGAPCAGRGEDGPLPARTGGGEEAGKGARARRERGEKDRRPCLEGGVGWIV